MELLYELDKVNFYKTIGDKLLLQGHNYFSMLYYEKVVLFMLSNQVKSGKKDLEVYKDLKRKAKKSHFLKQHGKYELILDRVIGSKEMQQSLFKLNGIKLSKDYDTIIPIKKSSVFIVEVNNKFGVIDINGEVLVKPLYDKVIDYQKGILTATFNGDSLIVVNSKLVDKYEGVGSVNKDLIATKKNNKWGFIKSSGETVIPHHFKSVGSFKNGICPFKQEEKWGYLNLKGEIVVKGTFETASNLDNLGLGIVKMNSAQYYINSQGIILGLKVTNRLKTTKHGL